MFLHYNGLHSLFFDCQNAFIHEVLIVIGVSIAILNWLPFYDINSLIIIFITIDSELLIISRVEAFFSEAGCHITFDIGFYRPLLSYLVHNLIVLLDFIILIASHIAFQVLSLFSITWIKLFFAYSLRQIFNVIIFLST